jgi:sulfatase maturation enzyme AslB (radical SAM superfamily)
MALNPSSVQELLPRRKLFGKDTQRLYTFNIVVTGRCNAACVYCHYYLARDRKSVAYDISDEQFDLYMDFVSYWYDIIPGYTTYRFSGGDPMVLGDRLFELAKRGFERTGTKPFVLTAGKALDQEWADKAKESKLSHAFVSIENPIRPARGAPNPYKVIKGIKELNSEQFPIVPGVCVIPNDCFDRLFEICSWFYNELGRIPVIAEINYGAYESPTEEQWQALARNLELVVDHFAEKTHLNLFSSVSPELAYGSHDPYIFELDLDNSYHMTRANFREKLHDVAARLGGENYPRLGCKAVECTWREFCENTKWYWRGDARNAPSVKIADYCRFKRLVNDIYYRSLVDHRHPDTMCSVTL